MSIPAQVAAPPKAIFLKIVRLKLTAAAFIVAGKFEFSVALIPNVDTQIQPEVPTVTPVVCIVSNPVIVCVVPAVTTIVVPADAEVLVKLRNVLLPNKVLLKAYVQLIS